MERELGLLIKVKHSLRHPVDGEGYVVRSGDDGYESYWIRIEMGK